ncbi:MAG: hypothetical protein WD468_10920, partial [Pirellulales bacterium]
MREPEPDYSIQQYERPNQPWVCGLADGGHACAVGPTARGGCPALGECAPVRDGDRWRCNRSALRGGECDEGPMPEGGCGRVLRCHPVRSFRSKRGRFVAALTVFAAGSLFIMLSSNWRDVAIAPGPLSQQHAQLLERGGMAGNCAACHSAAERSVGGWAAAMLVGHGAGASQSDRCMECHDKSISRELALVAHNVPVDVLNRVARQELQATGVVDSNRDDHALRRGLRDVPHGADELACATCHREHHGAAFDLTAIDNSACQSCHQQRYHSFADDHPDFGAWPYERRTRIAFNHASHQAKHFAEKKQAFECRQCHVDDATRHNQLLVSYEAACAVCHDEKIATSVARGVPMLVLPTLDVAALKAAGHDIGPWPAAATGDFDGRLPPAMKLLLAADPGAAKAIATLGADFEFMDVDPQDATQLAACAELAGAIKSLLADVSQRGPLAVRERLSVALGRDVSDARLDALVAGLSVDTVRGAASAWLPGAEVGRNPWTEGGMLSSRSGVSMSEEQNNMPTPLRGEGMPPSVAFDPSGSWSRDDATLSIRYRPAAHADPVLASWLSLLAETPKLDSRPLEMALFKELSKPTAAGLCASCHSVEEAVAGAFVVNWKALFGALSRELPREFTKFSHGPHLLLPALGDCSQCHAIDTATTATSYAGWNPHSFVSEFRAMSKRQCAECHTATAAGNACQSCHHYHVDRVEAWRIDGTDTQTGAAR